MFDCGNLYVKSNIVIFCFVLFLSCAQKNNCENDILEQSDISDAVVVEENDDTLPLFLSNKKAYESYVDSLYNEELLKGRIVNIVSYEQAVENFEKKAMINKKSNFEVEMIIM